MGIKVDGIVKLEGRVLEVSEHSTPGAWDFDLLPPYYYMVTYLDENNKVAVISAGNDRSAITVDATEEVKAVYAAYKAELKAKRLAEERERDLHTAKRGRLMRVLKGKNKDFVGVVRWVGETKFGPSALLVSLTNPEEKVFTKPTNVVMLEESRAVNERTALDKMVKVLNGPNAGKVGVVEWAGLTKFGKMSARIKVEGEEKPVWTTLTNLEEVA